MSDQEIIKVENVSMKFSLASEKIDSFKDYFIKTLKQQISYNEFWALKDVSFTVNRGEALGLIGLNGSGKSTMLKVIAGVLKPTRGIVEVRGTIAPLIELGAGFDMDLTASENIFLNGALLGYSRKDMEMNALTEMKIKEILQKEASNLTDDATVVLMAKVLLMPAEESDSPVGKILNIIRCAYLVGFEQALETYN